MKVFAALFIISILSIAAAQNNRDSGSRSLQIELENEEKDFDGSLDELFDWASDLADKDGRDKNRDEVVVAENPEELLETAEATPNRTPAPEPVPVPTPINTPTVLSPESPVFSPIYNKVAPTDSPVAINSKTEADAPSQRDSPSVTVPISVGGIQASGPTFPIRPVQEPTASTPITTVPIAVSSAPIVPTVSNAGAPITVAPVAEDPSTESPIGVVPVSEDITKTQTPVTVAPITDETTAPIIPAPVAAPDMDPNGTTESPIGVVPVSQDIAKTQTPVAIAPVTDETTAPIVPAPVATPGTGHNGLASISPESSPHYSPFSPHEHSPVSPHHHSPSSPHHDSPSSPSSPSSPVSPSSPYWGGSPSSPHWSPHGLTPSSPVSNPHFTPTQSRNSSLGAKEFNATAAPIAVSIHSPVALPSMANLTEPPVAVVGMTAPVIGAMLTQAPVLNGQANFTNVTFAPVTINMTMAPVAAPIQSLNGSEAPVASGTILDCGGEYNGFEVVTFRYSVEVATGFQSENVISDLETGLSEYLAKEFLECFAGSERRLQDFVDVGIRAFDSLPKDEPSSRAFCASTIHSENECIVVDGYLRAMLGESADADSVRFRVRSIVKEYLDGVPNLEGLALSMYISPAIFDPSNINGVRSRSGRLSSDDGSVDTESAVLFGLAGAAFACSVGIALWFRKRRNPSSMMEREDEHTARGVTPATPLSPPPPIAHIDTVDTGYDGTEELISPFSEMLPSAYRLGTPTSINTARLNDMSIILETNESSCDASGILISEGYTTDGGESDLDSSAFAGSYINNLPILGAARRTEGSALDI